MPTSRFASYQQACQLKNMRLTAPEQTIINCICYAKETVNYTYLIELTGMDFKTINKILQQLVADDRIEIGPNGGFALTLHAGKNPVIRQLIQETAEERLWRPGRSNYHTYKKAMRTFYGNRYIYMWAKKIRRLAFASIGQKI